MADGLTLIKEILKTAKDTGNIIASKELTEKRVIVCNMCEYYSHGKCAVCGCHMKLKARILAAECPKDRWRQKILQEELTGQMSETFEPSDCCV